MTMTNCPSCGADVSTKAFDCPSCGHPLRKPRRGPFGLLFKWLLILFNLLMLAWLISAIGATSEVVNNSNSDAEAAGAAIGSAIGLGMILVVWVLGDIILGLVTLLTRPRK